MPISHFSLSTSCPFGVLPLFLTLPIKWHISIPQGNTDKPEYQIYMIIQNYICTTLISLS